MTPTTPPLGPLQRRLAGLPPAQPKPETRVPEWVRLALEGKLPVRVDYGWLV